MEFSNPASQVWPSGGDLAATVAPTTPLPPALLSTTMLQPVWWVSLAWMMRVIGSADPPGGKGTTNLMLPLGQSFWALTIAGTLRDAATVPANTARRRNTDISASQTLSYCPVSVSTCNRSASAFADRILQPA